MKYTTSHEWVKIDQEIATIGITNYAQKELGEIVFIELPKVGSKLCIGQEVAVLESTKAAVDVYAALSGEVLFVNEELTRNPGLVNTSAEQEGWLFAIKMAHPEEKEALLSLTAYQQMIQGI